MFIDEWTRTKDGTEMIYRNRIVSELCVNLRDLENTEGRSDVLDNVIVLLPPTVFISSLSEHKHIGSIGYVNIMYSTCTSNRVVLEMLYALMVIPQPMSAL